MILLVQQFKQPVTANCGISATVFIGGNASKILAICTVITFDYIFATN